jgi:hypothetical protein
VGDGLEEVHRGVEAAPADHRERRHQGGRERHVDEPEPAGGVADRGREPLDLGARELRLEQLAAADPQARQHSQGEDDDPHPPEPLRELPPHRDRVVQPLDVDEDA